MLIEELCTESYVGSALTRVHRRDVEDEVFPFHAPALTSDLFAVATFTVASVASLHVRLRNNEFATLSFNAPSNTKDIIHQAHQYLEQQKQLCFQQTHN